MTSIESFEKLLTPDELTVISSLTTPAKIQAFLDATPYSTDPIYRCPLRVIRERKAHCFDGALFAAAMLRRLGHAPRVIDMLPYNDDDHILAVYQIDGFWGCVAKSNFTVLRSREPVYRSLRELIMSYFDVFFNTVYEKTLRGYTVPLDLSAFDRFDWMTSDDCLEEVANRLDRIRRYTVITPEQIARLEPVDEKIYQAGLAGADTKGLFKPEKS